LNIFHLPQLQNPLNCSFDGNLSCQANDILNQIDDQRFEVRSIQNNEESTEHFGYSVYQSLNKVRMNIFESQIYYFGKDLIHAFLEL